MSEPIAQETQQRLTRLASQCAVSISTAAVSPELQHALRLLGAPWKAVGSSGGLCSASVTAAQRTDSHDDISVVRPPEGDEGYSATHGQNGDLLIQAWTEHGLANGLYALRRRLLAAAEAGGRIRPSELLPPGPSAPAFALRDTYQFLSPWRLPHLSCDALTIQEWKAHLDRMRALNVRRWYFDIWSDQYYHPECPETTANAVLYERMKTVADYAHELGLRTGVYLFPAQIPVSVYMKDPRTRAKEATNYHGINGCLTKAWDEIIRFDVFLLKYFESSLDDVVVEMQDPGSCLCRECVRDFPDIVLRLLRTYRGIGRAGRNLDLCTLHFRDWLEEPGGKTTGAASAIPNLRARVFDGLPPETTLVDIDDPTLDMGASRGFRRNYFFFDLDPESGVENQQVFPRVKLRRIETQIRASMARGHDGVTAYRMMPFAGYVADYVLFRKLWDPALPVRDVLADLAAELGIAAQERPMFVDAMEDIDAWWEAKDLDALRRADMGLRCLAASNSGIVLHDTADTVAILMLLAEYLFAHAERVREDDFYPPAELVSSVRERMLSSRLFDAYTVHQHWVFRSEEIVGQRIRWWLKGIDCELRGALPAGAV